MSDRLYQKLLQRIKGCVSPSEEELVAIEKRLKQYDDVELIHLEKNFEVFGIEVILECMCSAVSLKNNKEKKN